MQDGYPDLGIECLQAQDLKGLSSQASQTFSTYEPVTFLSRKHLLTRCDGKGLQLACQLNTVQSAASLEQCSRGVSVSTARAVA